MIKKMFIMITGNNTLYEMMTVGVCPPDERSPFGPSPLGRPPSETRPFLSPPTLLDGPPRVSPQFPMMPGGRGDTSIKHNTVILYCIISH